ncbi:MAG: hypothetical protein AAF633_12725 [Chloroflexota bacterium]
MEYFEYIYPQSHTLNEADFDQVRQPIIDWLIWGSAIAATAVLMLELVLGVTSLQPVFWAGAALILWVLNRSTDMRQSFRTIFFIATVQTIGIIELATIGPTSWEVLLLCFVPLMATCLVSLRIGAISLMISFIAYGLTVSFTPDLPEARTDVIELYGISLAFTFAISMVLGIYIFSRYNLAVDQAIKDCAEIEVGLEKLLQVQQERIETRRNLIFSSTTINQQLSNLLIEDMVVRALVEETHATHLFEDFLVYIFPSNQLPIAAEPAAGFIRHQVGKFNDTHRLVLSYEPILQLFDTLETVIIEKPTLVQAEDTQSAITPHTVIQPGTALVPLYLGETFIGFLLAFKGPDNPLNSDDLFYLETVASQTAISIRNARIFEKERRLAHNEVIIQAVIEKIQKAESIGEVLKIASETLGTHLRSDIKINIGIPEKSPFT